MKSLAQYCIVLGLLIAIIVLPTPRLYAEPIRRGIIIGDIENLPAELKYLENHYSSISLVSPADYAQQIAPLPPPTVSTEVRTEFRGISVTIAKGIKRYFYRGHHQAIEILAPIVELGFKNIKFLSYRPDIADQIIQAAIVLIRAYQDVDNHQAADVIAHKLIQQFPTLPVNDEVIPPTTLKLLEKALVETKAQQNMLTTYDISNENCELYINGIAVQQPTIEINTNYDYYVLADCGIRAPQLWHHRSNIPGSHFLITYSGDGATQIDDALTNRTDNDRKIILQALLQILSLDFVFFIRSPSTNKSANTIYFLSKDEHPKLTNINATQDAVEDLLIANFGTKHKSHVISMEHESSSTNWWPLTLMSSGAILAAGGSWMFFYGRAQAHEIHCSPSSLSQLPASECTGVPRLYFASQNDFNSAKSRASTFQFSGIGMIAVGIGLFGGGLWSWYKHTAPPPITQSSSRRNVVTWDVGLNEIKATFHW